MSLELILILILILITGGSITSILVSNYHFKRLKERISELEMSVADLDNATNTANRRLETLEAHLGRRVHPVSAHDHMNEMLRYHDPAGGLDRRGNQPITEMAQHQHRVYSAPPSSLQDIQNAIQDAVRPFVGTIMRGRDASPDGRVTINAQIQVPPGFGLDPRIARLEPRQEPNPESKTIKSDLEL